MIEININDSIGMSDEGFDPRSTYNYE